MYLFCRCYRVYLVLRPYKQSLFDFLKGRFIMKLEVPETFEDVAVEFSGEEWEMLSKPEKELHKEVMVQNYENMISVGYNIPVDHLWLYIKNFETVSPCETKAGMMVQQILVPGTRTSRYDIPVDHLWLYVKNFETVSPCDTKAGMMVQQILDAGTRTSSLPNLPFFISSARLDD
ncbi:zinc finger protein 454-like isoform X2 [Protopterus annectens]|uniref:zinc finger protein 454-like isoform X2 n=1 Tax=Protopterus annectens TaxID=7888 RepID=UPI001CFA7ABC|nr:zinc finger protein 454-like isoform X2 [Protopterus annectens]